MAKVTAADIKSIVCARYGVPKSDIDGTSQRKAAIRARHVAFYLTRKHCHHMSPAAIGLAFGGKDRTTILYGERMVSDSDPDVVELSGAIFALESGCKNIASLIARRDIQARRICIEIVALADKLAAIESGYEMEEAA